MKSAISIGLDMGGPEPCAIADLKVDLYRSLAQYVNGTHCDAIDEFAIVLRVDGSIAKFGDEGIANLRFSKSRRTVTLDVQIPEAVWQPLSRQQTKAYLAKVIKTAIDDCVVRLKKEKCGVNASELEGQVAHALREYLGPSNAA